MSPRFAGRVAIVTGGASGIGAATARALVAEGARVVVVDIDAERGRALSDEIGAVSDEASYVTGTTLVVDGGLTAGTGIPDLVPGV